MKRTDDRKSGNASLVERGARWIPDELESLDDLMRDSTTGSSEASRAELPLFTPEVDNPIVRDASAKVSDTSGLELGSFGREGHTIKPDQPVSSGEADGERTR